MSRSTCDSGGGPQRCVMARSSRLDSFLKRNTEREVYERIVTSEPCVVMSDTVHRAYMHVVLSDERVYVTEYPPRALTEAVSFSRVRHIELVNDLPAFLSGRDRKRCQHIRIIYTSAKPAGKSPPPRQHDLRTSAHAAGKSPPPRQHDLRTSAHAAGKSPPPRQHDLRTSAHAAGKSPPPRQHDLRTSAHAAGKSPPPRQHDLRTSAKPTGKSPPPRQHDLRTAAHAAGESRWGVSPESPQRKQEVCTLKAARSASCPDPETLGLPRPPSPTQEAVTFVTTPVSPTSPSSPSERSPDTPEPEQVRGSKVLMGETLGSPHYGALVRRRRRRGSMLRKNREKSGERERDEEEREAELHLYAVSQDSRLFLHLQSCWNRFIIRSTLLVDPLSSVPSSPHRRLPALSCERTEQLFSQLRVELLQVGVGGVLVLLQELQAASQRSVMLRRLFWRSAELFVFLVQTLEDSQRRNNTLQHTADQLLLRTATVQTLAVMFRETELEPSRLTSLTANRGSVTSRMLLALICDPHEPETCSNPELKPVLSEYLDSACSLLSELLLLGHQAYRCSSAESFLTVGWILRVLQPHPHLFSFVGYQAERLVFCLSDVRPSVLSPSQSVLMFERCRLLLMCLRHSSQLSQHLRSHYREEFRYYVTLKRGEQKLPPCYPISRPALRLVQQILTLILH